MSIRRKPPGIVVRFAPILVLFVLTLFGGSDPALTDIKATVGAQDQDSQNAGGLPDPSTTADQTAQEGVGEVELLIDNENYAEAEAKLRPMLAEAERTHGPRSAAVAQLLDLLVKVLRLDGWALEPETRELAERAVNIRKELVGPSDPSVATGLENLALILYELGDYAGARPLFERLLEIRERTLGPDHTEVASTLNNLGILLRESGELQEAQLMHEKALAIYEAKRGPDDLDVARVLSNLGNVQSDRGDYAGARISYERALAIEEKALGSTSPEVATTANNLAVLLKYIGDYQNAHLLFERCLRIEEATLGPSDFKVGETLLNLGNYLIEMGDYVGAQEHLTRALRILQEELPPDHVYIGYAYWSLAGLYHQRGDYAEALSNYGLARPILEGQLGPDNLIVAEFIVAMAMAMHDSGDLAGARVLYDRALAIQEAELDPNHPTVAITLKALSLLQSEVGDHLGAESSLVRALEIEEGKFGPEHIDVAATLVVLAGELQETEQTDAARQSLERALAIQEKVLGTDHPHVAQTLGRLSMTRLASDDSRGAFDAAIQSEQIARRHLRLTVRTLPERQALRYGSVRASGIDILLSLTVESEPEDPSFASRSYGELVRSRALVFDEMAYRRRTVVTSTDPEVNRLAAAYLSERRRLANLMVRGPEELRPALLDSARRECEKAEAALASKSASFQAEQERYRIDLAQVAGALPPNNSLVSYVIFERYLSSAGRIGGSGTTVTSYGSFVLHSGDTEPTFLLLGSAEEIDSLVIKWRDETASRVGQRPPRQAEESYRTAGESLRRKIWDPVAEHVSDVDQVFVVPDGALNLVSIATLPVGETHYVVDRPPLIHYLTAERDLVPSEIAEPEGVGLLAFGGPDFDAIDQFTAQAPTEEAQKHFGDPKPEGGVHRGQYRGELSRCGGFREVRFTSLPQSIPESEKVVALWEEAGGGEHQQGTGRTAASNADLLTGSTASEPSFKVLTPGRQVVHLATHGFFLEGRCPSALETERGIGGLKFKDSESPPVPAGENPLLLSGLALAGANHRDEAGPEEDDGILTAEEVAALNLGGVRWAVLSACETGVGTVQAGEGVFGLRRAFQIAGTKTLIMSLWPVEDVAGREWMERLYAARLVEGLSTAEAVRRANLDVLNRRREEGQSTHPYYWGAFVAAGDWR
jgi:tetratricopeptide (TPR) repeat protein